jgi:hypothetical protein
LQKCENNIIFNYFARSYSKLMLNRKKLIWKELLSFIHFMGLSWKKKFKLIQDVSKYFGLTQNISKYLQIYQETFLRPFCLHYGWTYMNFIRDDVGNDVKHDARDAIHDINIIIIMSQNDHK